TKVPERAGAAHESEDTQPLCVDIDVALAALADGRLHNGYLIMALQWLALNRHRIGAFAAGGLCHDPARPRRGGSACGSRNRLGCRNVGYPISRTRAGPPRVHLA